MTDLGSNGNRSSRWRVTQNKRKAKQTTRTKSSKQNTSTYWHQSATHWATIRIASHKVVWFDFILRSKVGFLSDEWRRSGKQWINSSDDSTRFTPNSRWWRSTGTFPVPRGNQFVTKLLPARSKLILWNLGNLNGAAAHFKPEICVIGQLQMSDILKENLVQFPSFRRQSVIYETSGIN